MKAIDTLGLRRMASQARLSGQEIKFGPDDVLAVCDEVDLAREAVGMAGKMLTECRAWIAAQADPKTLDLERKRMRDSAGDLLQRLSELLDAPAEAVSLGEAPKPDPLADLVIHRGKLPPVQ
jgi:hypothetical protein